MTEYHESGSLFHYLNKYSITAASMIRLAYTAACGIAHIHLEIVGNRGKPAMAHRDIKTKNILVKTNGECCIADFGLAVRQDRPEIVQKINVGTLRYRAPECLDETLKTNHFNSFQEADVYGFSLVLWEIARRCSEGDVCEEYQPPYYDLVPANPSLKDMTTVVCHKKHRP